VVKEIRYDRAGSAKGGQKKKDLALFVDEIKRYSHETGSRAVA